MSHNHLFHKYIEPYQCHTHIMTFKTCWKAMNPGQGLFGSGVVLFSTDATLHFNLNMHTDCESFNSH